MRKITALLLIICVLMSLFAGCNLFDDGSKLTVMMYVVGSDLESENGLASSDIGEILNSKLDLKHINFLIYTGGAKGWRTAISNKINTVYQVVENDGVRQLAQISRTESPADMGDPAQLSAFLDFAYQNFPAKQFGLICWDHGGGPNQGFGYDENYEDFLELSEIAAAFEASPFKGTNKLSWIGFDACLMGSVEVGDTLKDYADYLIASEELEPGSGWDYGFLSDIRATDSAEAIAKACIDRFCAGASGTVLDSLGSELSQGLNLQTPMTLSCVDLRTIEPLNQAVDALFGAMEGSLQSENLLTLTYQRQSLYAFGSSAAAEGGAEPDLVDIGELAEVCRTDYPAEAEAVNRALSDYVVYQQSTVDQAVGVSIYYPFTGLYTFYYQGGCDSYRNYTASPQYVRYIQSFTDRCFSGVTLSDNSVSRNTSALSNAATDEKTITVNLTGEQKKTFSKAYVNVLEKFEDKSNYWNNDYVPLLLDYQITPDENGNLSFDSDMAVPVHVNGAEQFPLPMRQVLSSAQRSTYQTLTMLLIAAPETMPDTAWEAVYLSAAYADISDDLRITSIRYADKTGHSLGKNDIDPEDWNYYESFMETRMPTYNDDGALLPFSEWEERDSYLMMYASFDRNMSLKMVPLSQCERGEYYYQVIIEDIYGNRQSSELFSFEKGEPYETVTEKTDSGSLTYRLYADRAEVESYEGTDSRLAIPASFRDVPVTLIREEAFPYSVVVEEVVIENPDIDIDSSAFGSAKIGKITLPEGMKVIGEKAFLGCCAREIVIPATVETIERHAFMRCGSLTELRIPPGVKEIGMGAFSGTIPENGISFTGENEKYKIENDYLLSKDGKVAYACFEESEICTIPDGVTEIASWCCIGAPVKRFNGQQEPQDVGYWVMGVRLPDSLRIIRSDAFRNCMLTELTIPDSVEYIGHNAFANYESEYKDPNAKDAPEHPNVKIGKGLKKIGKEVFGYNMPASLTVSEENAYFSAVNGRLMNKAGDYEIPLTKETNIESAREGEYKALEALRSTIDLSGYEPVIKDEYYYEGQSYYQQLKSKLGMTQTPQIDDTVDLDGFRFTLPCKLSEMLDAGFVFHNPNDSHVELKTDDSYGVSLENSSGQQFTANCSNTADSKKPLSETEVTGVTVQAENGVGFLAGGVSSAIDIDRVVNKLGAPREISAVYKNAEKSTLVTLMFARKISDKKSVYLYLYYLYSTETGEFTAYKNWVSVS